MKYTYDNGNVVKIDKHGVIHAIASGTVTVTGTTDYGVYSMFTVTVADPDFTRKTGDVNGDGWVDVSDLICIKRHIVSVETLTGKDLLAAISSELFFCGLQETKTNIKQIVVKIIDIFLKIILLYDRMFFMK